MWRVVAAVKSNPARPWGLPALWPAAALGVVLFAVGPQMEMTRSAVGGLMHGRMMRFRMTRKFVLGGKCRHCNRHAQRQGGGNLLHGQNVAR